MSAHNLSTYILIQGHRARLQGYIAENQKCVLRGWEPTYSEDHFENIAKNIEHLAGELDHG